jgi:uncharacterized ferritin-like protein (DUF455 family)
MLILQTGIQYESRWDIMARFGPMHKDLPPSFFSDFTKMALDESKHLYVVFYFDR